jgi:hypothetical protein
LLPRLDLACWAWLQPRILERRVGGTVCGGSHPPEVLLGAGAGGSKAMYAVGAISTK